MGATLIAALALIVLSASGGLGQSLPVSVRLQLIASLERATVKQGAPVNITVRVRNIGIDLVAINECDPYYDYGFVVRDAAGKESARPDFWQSLLDAPVFKCSDETLPAGQEHEITLDLTKFYVLPPGSYRLQAVLNLFKYPLESADWAHEKGISNQLQLTIIP